MYSKILFKIPLSPRMSYLKTTNIIQILYPLRLKIPLKIITNMRSLYSLSLSYYNGIQLFSCVWFISTERNNNITKSGEKTEFLFTDIFVWEVWLMPGKNMSLSSSSLLKENGVTPSGCGSSVPGFPSLSSFHDFWTQCWILGFL